jgi:hypothetical protein
MLSIGLTFALLTFLVELFMVITMTSCRGCLHDSCGCKCLAEGSVMDEKMAAIEEQIMSKFKKYLVKRIIMSKLRRQKI